MLKKNKEYSAINKTLFCVQYKTYYCNSILYIIFYITRQVMIVVSKIIFLLLMQISIYYNSFNLFLIFVLQFNNKKLNNPNNVLEGGFICS